MSQIHISLLTLRRKAPRPAYAWWVDGVIILVIVAAAYGIVVAASRWATPLTPATQINLSPLSLPLYAGLSTFRMATAFLLSLVFSLVYARIAVASKVAERVMVPLLGLLTLIVVIVLLDQLLWRPLIAWADRFSLSSHLPWSAKGVIRG